MRHFSLAVILLWLLGACATGPVFDSAAVNRSLTPARVAAGAPDATGKTVLWGGTIITTTNLKDSTRLEVLSFPLDSDEKPQRDKDSLGRVMFDVRGYLEPATYAEGRMITLVGKVSGTQAGKVGDSDYSYPVVSSEQLYLWPQESERDNTGVHFGIGVGFGL